MKTVNLWKVAFWPQDSKCSAPDEMFIACEGIADAVDGVMRQWTKPRVVSVCNAGRVLVTDDRNQQP